MADVESAKERHTYAVYDVLADLAEPDDIGNNVVACNITDVYRNLDITPSYHKDIRRVLFDSNPPCLTMVARGGGGKPSVFYVHRRPEEKDFASDLTDVKESAKLSAGQIAERLERLEARLAGLNIVEALRNHEHRIAQLEAREGLSKNQGESTNGTD